MSAKTPETPKSSSELSREVEREWFWTSEGTATAEVRSADERAEEELENARRLADEQYDSAMMGSGDESAERIVIKRDRSKAARYAVGGAQLGLFGIFALFRAIGHGMSWFRKWLETSGEKDMKTASPLLHNVVVGVLGKAEDTTLEKMAKNEKERKKSKKSDKDKKDKKKKLEQVGYTDKQAEAIIDSVETEEKEEVKEEKKEE